MPEEHIIHPSDLVDSKHRLLAIIALLRSYKALDFDKASKVAELSVSDFSLGLPAAMGETLSDSCSDMLLNSETPGEFVVAAISAIGTIANQIGMLLSFTSHAELENMVKSLEAYNSSPAGSTGEVLASKRVEEFIAKMNERTLELNNSFFGAFSDTDIGFGISALNILVDDDSDDEDDEDDDSDGGEPSPSLETLTPKPGVHG